MSPADNTPNFDTMSPEEIIAWMETLAKRQGASEGITTTANVEIPEIDPSTVEINEPGYVPYGKDPKKWAEEEAARKAAQPPRPVTAAPPPAAVPPERPAAPPAAPPQPMRPAAQMPLPAAPPPPASQNTMSWLESLAADQSGGVPELDLSALAADITPTAPASKQPAANPIDWLESLTQGQEEETQSAAPVPAAEAADPFAEGVDPMSWLETMARRQGAKQEELTTEANVNVPSPQDVSSLEGPGYTPYSFDALGLSSRPAEESLPSDLGGLEEEVEAAELEDPAAWLDSLASSQGFTPEVLRGASAKADQPLTDDDIRVALERGEDIPHEAMERWMNRQLEIGAQRDEPEPEYDPDAPAVPAELPDWLIEQVGSAAPPEDVVTPAPSQPALIDVIAEPPPVENIPDWLKDEVAAESDLDSLFVTPQEEPPVAEAFTMPSEIDDQDSWAEALEYERQQDVDAVPDWYLQNINDPARRAAVDRQLYGEVEEFDEALEEVALEPEAGLPLGQPEEMPDWLSEAAVEAELPDVMPMEEMPDWLRSDVEQPIEPAAVIAEPAADIPDWLKSVDVDEVPDWLKETISPPPAPTPVPPQPVVSQPVVSQPIVSPPPPVIQQPVAPPPPAPAMPPAARVDAPALLTDARSSISGGDVEGGLRHYEALVRANVELDSVASDLAKLAERHKSNAAIYRVWGDGLMRQGKLQAALDTYRKALNQL